MTGFQIAAAAGALLAVGGVLLVLYLIPATPALGPALTRLAAGPDRPRSAAAWSNSDITDAVTRVGQRMMTILPARQLAATPRANLALLRKSPARFYGEKLLSATAGLVLVPLVVFVLSSFAVTLPIVVSPLLSVALAVGLWFAPDRDVRLNAKEARVEFNHAITAFLDMVALERRAGSGARQAMLNAARVGAGHWVFDRIADAMVQAEMSGRAPWDVLHDLAEEMQLAQLDDLADMMALVEKRNVQVYERLREHCAALRVELLTNEQSLANVTNDNMVIPGAMMGMISVALMLTPALLNLITAG